MQANRAAQLMEGQLWSVYYCILGFTEVDILCALSLYAVVLRAVEVRDYHEELAGREVLINAAVPCILKAQFQLCGDG